METRKISISLHDNEAYIRKQCENCDDILIRPMRLGEGHKADCLMVYIEVAVSNMMLDDSAIGKMINHFWEIPEEKIREFIRRNSLGIADVKELSSMEEVFGAVLSGNAVFFLDGYDKAMKISSKGYPGLPVSEVKTEKVLRGSKEDDKSSLVNIISKFRGIEMSDDQIKGYVSDAYSTLKDMGVTKSDVKNIFEKAIEFIKGMLSRR